MGIYKGIGDMGTKRFLKNGKNSGSILSAMGSGMAIGMATPIISIIGILILMYTGIWWFPLIITYFVVIVVPFRYIYEKRESVSYRYQVGHEAFFTDYPEYLAREVRMAQKKGIPESVKQIADYYRSCPLVVDEFHPKKEFKRRIKAAFKYAGAGLAAAIGLFMIWDAFPIPKDFFTQDIKTADFTSAFLISGGILALISAVGLFRNIPFFSVRFSAAALMLLSVWSSFIAYTFEKRPNSSESVAYLVCLIIFIVVAFVIPAVAQDIRTAEELARNRKELKITLFEIGLIEEKELHEFDVLKEE